MNPAWSKFIKRMPIRASREKIYQAWSTQQGLESWFLRRAEFIKADGAKREATEFSQSSDKYFWQWHGYGDEVFENREWLQANGKDLIQFRFTGDCIVTVRIKEEGDDQILELEQTGIEFVDDPNHNLYIGCGEGWVFYLTNLKSILEGGLDLRNKNMNFKNVANS